MRNLGLVLINLLSLPLIIVMAFIMVFIHIIQIFVPKEYHILTDDMLEK